MAREPLGHARRIERDPVRRQIDLGDARLLVQEIENLPELRVHRGLATRDLHRVQPALKRDQARDGAAEFGERQHAVTLRVGVADAACKVARVGYLHEHRATLVGTLVRDVGQSLPRTGGGPTPPTFATTPPLVRPGMTAPPKVTGAPPTIH